MIQDLRDSGEPVPEALADRAFSGRGLRPLLLSRDAFTEGRILRLLLVFVHEVGSEVPVVLLHGFALDHRSLLPLESTFARSPGWRRLYFDLPGATRSPAASVSSSQEVADAVCEEIVSALDGEPFAVVGASFGGMIARHVAHRLRPQVLGLATLAGVFVAPRDERDVPRRTVLRRDPQIEPLLGSALEQYREDAVVESVEDARAFLTWVLPGLEGADQDALNQTAQAYRLDREPEDEYPEPFTRPTLHITGRQDDVVGHADAWRRLDHYPRASFVVLDGAGHDLLFEQAELCSALTAGWLRDVQHHM